MFSRVDIVNLSRRRLSYYDNDAMSWKHVSRKFTFVLKIPTVQFIGNSFAELGFAWYV